MEVIISQYLSEVLQGFSTIGLLLVFAGGIITSIGPCNMAMIPVLMAYVGGTSDATKSRSFWLSLSFTLGTSTTFALLGLVAALIGGIFGISKVLLSYLAAVVSIVVGLKMLGIICIHLPNFGARFLRRPERQGMWAAFIMGLLIGLAGSQCGTPVLFAILSLVMAKGKLVYGAVLLFLYGLGRGLPVIVLGTLTGCAKGLPTLSKWSAIFEQIAGGVLIAVGLYFIWSA